MSRKAESLIRMDMESYINAAKEALTNTDTALDLGTLKEKGKPIKEAVVDLATAFRQADAIEKSARLRAGVDEY